MARATPRTIRELLAVTRDFFAARGIETPRLDAELLLSHALGESRLQLFLDLDRPLVDDERDAYRALVRRRALREPVALIVGEREFYGLPMTVTPGVLVPRPDTETLVDAALEAIADDTPGVVIDVCTGTGCVAVALAPARPRLCVIATDIDPAAVACAEENVARHGLCDRVQVRQGDLLEGLDPAEWGARGPLFGIVGNPPYLRDDEKDGLMPEVRDFEPAGALFGEGDDGLGHHRRLLTAVAAGSPFGDAGFVMLEIGFDQGPAIRGLTTTGWTFSRLVRDLGGRERVAVFLSTKAGGDA